MITLEEQIEFLMGIVDDSERAEELNVPSKWTQHIHHFKAILSTLEKVRDSKQAHACVGEWVERKKPSTE